MIRQRAWWPILVGLLFVGPALAQTGGIVVRVSDPSGAPLARATVVLSSESGQVKTTSEITDTEGLATFPVLRSGGGYRVDVALPGFGPVQVADLRVRINGTTEVPVRLSRRTEERIEVTATTDVVELDRTEASTRFTEELIHDLPVAGRFYQNVLTLTPGVEDPDGDGNPNVFGSRSRDFKAIVGGVSNVDPLTGQWMSRINPNSIEEIEVITAGAGVEFGRAQGGYARVVQKQGSNELEGVVDVLWSSALDQTFRNSNGSDPDVMSLQAGFQLSGPILRDRLWYRLSHEWIRRQDPVDTLTGTDTVDTTAGTHADQLTWQASPRNKLAFSYQADPLEIDNFGVSALVSPESSQRRSWNGETFSLTWTAPYSPKILIESQAAWQNLEVGIFPSTEATPNDCVTGLESLVLSECFDVSRSRTSGSASRSLDDQRQRLTVRSDLTTYAGRFLGASHQIKTGFIVENERYFRSLQQLPRSRLFVVKPFTLEDGELLEPGMFLAVQLAVPQSSEIRATGISWGVYVEDQIKPTSNFVLTLGLRHDREEIDSEGHSPFDPRQEQARFLDLLDANFPAQQAVPLTFTAFEGTADLTRQMAQLLGLREDEVLSQLSPLSAQSAFWYNTRRLEDIDLVNSNLAPYLGLSWDPWSNGKTKLALVASRHYNNIPLGVPLVDLEPVVSDLTWRVDPDTRRVSRLYSGVNLGLSTKMVDHELRTPYQDELFLSFERQIAPETSLGISYVKRRYRDQLQDVDINRFTGDFGRCHLATAVDPRPIIPIPGDGSSFGGDGIVDDCVGATETAPGVDPFHRTVYLSRPDGKDDLYIANPGWVDVLLLGNFNSADYDALVLEVVRRQYRNWQMLFSYTYSRSIGDGEDYLQQYGNDNALVEDERGYQSDDRRHVVKLNATLTPGSGWRVGTALSWRSGLPYSIITESLSLDAVPPAYQNLGLGTPARPRQSYVNGQRNDQRNPSYWNLDLRLAKNLDLARAVHLQLSVEVFNVLNNQTYTIYNPLLGLGRQLNGENEAYRLPGRRWQFGLRLSF